MKTVVAFCCLIAPMIMLAAPPDWTVRTGHRNAMILYAMVVDPTGNRRTEAGSMLSASEQGELLGSTPVSIGPAGPVYQLKIGSDKRKGDLTYSFYDAKEDRVRMIAQGPGFDAGSLVGTIIHPITLTLSP